MAQHPGRLHHLKRFQNSKEAAALSRGRLLDVIAQAVLVHCTVPMDVESAKRRHRSLVFLQHLPTSDCIPGGNGNEEPVLLSGISRGQVWVLLKATSSYQKMRGLSGIGICAGI